MMNETWRMPCELLNNEDEIDELFQKSQLKFEYDVYVLHLASKIKILKHKLGFTGV